MIFRCSILSIPRILSRIIKLMEDSIRLLHMRATWCIKRVSIEGSADDPPFVLIGGCFYRKKHATKRTFRWHEIEDVNGMFQYFYGRWHVGTTTLRKKITNFISRAALQKWFMLTVDVVRRLRVRSTYASIFRSNCCVPSFSVGRAFETPKRTIFNLGAKGEIWEGFSRTFISAIAFEKFEIRITNLLEPSFTSSPKNVSHIKSHKTFANKLIAAEFRCQYFPKHSTAVVLLRILWDFFYQNK